LQYERSPIRGSVGGVKRLELGVTLTDPTGGPGGIEADCEFRLDDAGREGGLPHALELPGLHPGQDIRTIPGDPGGEVVGISRAIFQPAISRLKVFRLLIPAVSHNRLRPFGPILCRLSSPFSDDPVDILLPVTKPERLGLETVNPRPRGPKVVPPTWTGGNNLDGISDEMLASAA
jgi:hypothetical protein